MRKILWILFTALMLVSCKTKERIVEVEVPRIQTEYVTKHDTCWQRDSIFQVIEKAGDTVYNTKYVYKDKYLVKYKDSLRVDTITQVKEVKSIEYINKLNWFQSLLIYVGFAALLLLLIYISKKFIKP